MNIAQELKQVEKKIEKLKFELAVENAVYERLSAIDIGNEPTLFGNAPTIPGSMPNHIEAVLINAGKPMKVSAIVEAVKQRGATSASKTDKGIQNNVRGTLKRRSDLFARHKRGIYKLKHRAEKMPETQQH